MVSRKKWAIGGVAVLTPLIVWTGAMVALPMLGKAAFDSGSSSSVTRYQWAVDITPGFLEGWQAPYNLGTAQLAHDRQDAGVANLELALRRVRRAERTQGQIANTEGPECKVRANLSLGYEAQGKAAGKSGAKRLQKAIDTIQPCTSSKNNKDEQERQKKEKKEAETPNPNPSPNPSPSPNPNPSSNQNPSPSPNQNPTSSPDPNQSPSPGPVSPNGDPSPTPSSFPGESPDGRERELRSKDSEKNEKNPRYGDQRNGEPNW